MENRIRDKIHAMILKTDKDVSEVQDLIDVGEIFEVARVSVEVAKI